MTLAVIDIKRELAVASKPEQTKALEAMSSSAMAYAKEQDDYGLYLEAWQVYLMARRKTTELIKHDIESNIDVTAENYGFTKMQWSRRMKEFSVPQDKLDAYFDDIAAKGWNPSIAGMLRESNGEEIDQFARAVGDLLRGAHKLRGEFRNRLNRAQENTLEDVITTFEEA